jgi:hypothetical protein
MRQRNSNDPVKCVHCLKEVVTETFYGRGGTQWVHRDGYMECRPTYASPNLQEWIFD